METVLETMGREGRDPATEGTNWIGQSQVSHPPHYNQGKIEVIDAIEDWKLSFCLGNVVKYVARAEYKGWPLQDLKKARFYLDREILKREKEV